jgi:hypothetical protein
MGHFTDYSTSPCTVIYTTDNTTDIRYNYNDVPSFGGVLETDPFRKPQQFVVDHTEALERITKLMVGLTEQLNRLNDLLEEVAEGQRLLLDE